MCNVCVYVVCGCLCVMFVYVVVCGLCGGMY